VPFSNEVGRSMIAHLYNANAARHGGKAENTDVIYTCKQESKGMWIQDLERGVMAGIRPYPWQTDTSIGDWYYNKDWKYRGADWVIQMLVDIVAKNGNLLINVVQRPDGSLDPEAEQVLAEMAAWIAINGEAIYETRPWLIHGEGPVRAKGGHFGEDFAYTVKDIRFTCKGDKTLYAFAMGWPTDGHVVIRTLAKLPEVTAKITNISLLGSSAKITWKHDADGLAVELPGEAPCKYAVALKITGEDLRGFKPELAMPAAQAVPVVQADGAGNYSLEPDDAELHGDLKTENQGGKPNIGFWDKAEDWAAWKVNFKQAGSFKVSATCASIGGEPALAVEVADQKAEGKVPSTGAWDKFATVEMGVIEVKKASEQIVKLRPADPAKWKAVNLRWVKFARNPR